MTQRRKPGLGKGLEALIPMGDGAEAAAGDAIMGLRLLPIGAIRPNPHQPRSDFNPGALTELAQSIQTHGLIQPLVVHEAGPGDYTLIAGERRWRAAQLAGLTELPVVIKEATPQQMLEMALIENIQRADLNPLEEALAYQQLIQGFGLTHDEVGKRVGKSRSTITNTIRLLELPTNVRQAVINGQITGGHARALCALPSPQQQTAVMNSLIQGHWSVRKTEEVVRKILAAKRQAKKPLPQLSAEINDLQRQFREHLGAKVNIESGRQGGKIIIHYYSDEELHAIYATILGEKQS